MWKLAQWSRLRRLWSVPAIIGYLWAVIKPIWGFIGVLDTANFVRENMLWLWDYLSSPWGSNIVFFGGGLALILWALLRPEDSLAWREKENQQRGHEEQYMHPVLEWIDLDRRGLPANQIVLKFQIDSSLIYDFRPFRMWIKPVIGEWTPEDGTEILQPPNLLSCRRTQLPSQILIITDARLLERIERCREGAQMQQAIKILLQLRANESIKVLESYSITPW